MERIGLAASKMAKGNFILYNLYVVLIAFLFSSFVLVIAGSAVVFALIIINYIVGEIRAFEFQENLVPILKICLVSLTMIIGVFNLIAILKNLKITKGKDS